MGSVNYDRVARTYEQGRGPWAQADAWAKAVAPHLPRTARRRVLDLGAGTGIFARSWPAWGATHVLALDPSLSMLEEAGRVGLPDGAVRVNGRGEWLPLRNASIDVAWLSTVFHHFTDRERSVADLHRVLAGDGVVLVRAHFPDRAGCGWFDLFPGAQRALGRFPTLAEVTAVFERGGFERRAAELVPGGRAAASVFWHWARKMRHADSFLGALTNDEFDAGISALRRRSPEKLDLVPLHLAVFRRA